jgi:ectoine hydroxylase-related dioxygenase (phytanoyl-CoA dioxygenase family)
MTEYTKDDISLDKESATEEAILEKCNEYGVCVIDSFLDESTVSEIRSEISRMYDVEGLSGVDYHSELEYIRNLTVDYDLLDTGKFNAIDDLVSTPMLQNVTEAYYEEDNVQYPWNLWIANSKGTPNSPTGDPSDGSPYAYHIDQKNKFKFFFYLTDVDIENGPTYFVPEYVDEFKDHRLELLERNDGNRDFSNVIWYYHVSGEAESKGVPIVGDAGTLIIFDTDTPHRAGELKEGYEREILRIDTLSPKHSGVKTPGSMTMREMIKEGLQNPKGAVRYLYKSVM